MSKSTGNEIKFISNRDATEHLPNSYKVVIDGKEFGKAEKTLPINRWEFRLAHHNGDVLDYEKHPIAFAETFAVLKGLVVDTANAMPD